MGIYSFFGESINGDFVCEKCLKHYYLKLVSKERNILLKGYCYCGEITTYIETWKNLSLFKQLNFHIKLCIGGDNNFDKKPTKFCNDCKNFFCEKCLSKHNHKNIFDYNYFINKCKYHPNNELIGFCYECKKPICKQCIYIHNNHEMKYMEKLEISKEILEKYKNKLEKGFNDINNLLKIKYGEELDICEYLFDNNSTSNFISLNNIEMKNVVSLRILKILLDLYYYHKNKKTLDYQIISNILNHINFEIVEIQRTKIEKDKKYESIGNIEFFNPKEINKDINIDLKIYFKNEDKIINMNKNKNKKIIDIETCKIFYVYSEIQKVIKLKNGDLVLYCDSSSEFIIIHNLISHKYEIREKIKDFTQIDNEEYLIVILSKNEYYEPILNKLLFIIEEDNKIKIGKRIKLDSKKTYYNCINIGKNNIALLSFSKEEQKSYLELLDYKKMKYEIITLLNVEIYKGKILKIGNIITILYDFEENSTLFFYDIKNKTLQFLEIKMNLAGDENNLSSCINIIKYGNRKILLSNAFKGIIINVKTKQIESEIKYFNKIYCYGKVKGYNLVGSYDGIVSQINQHNNEIICSFKINTEDKIFYIKDIGNNQICIFTRYAFYLINYK